MSSKCSKAEILSDVGTENRKRGEAGHVAVNEKLHFLGRLLRNPTFNDMSPKQTMGCNNKQVSGLKPSLIHVIVTGVGFS